MTGGNGDDGARLAEIATRAAKATAAPWFVKSEGHGMGRLTPVAIVHPEGDPIAWRDADYAFVAEARADVPWLLARVRRLEAEAAELRRAAGEKMPVSADGATLYPGDEVWSVSSEPRRGWVMHTDASRRAYVKLTGSLPLTIPGGQLATTRDAALAASAGAGAKGGEGGGNG